MPTVKQAIERILHVDRDDQATEVPRPRPSRDGRRLTEQELFRAYRNADRDRPIDKAW